MKAFSNYDTAKKAAQSQRKEQLPAGAYVCEIKNSKYVEPSGDKSGHIVLAFDVSEGEYKGFYQKRYDADTSEDRKWPGRVFLYEPKDDGSEQDDWTKKKFAGWIDAIEKSNDGYLWDWDEKKLKGKYVGIVFGLTGKNIGGRDVTFTEPRFGTSVKLVRDGKAPEAKFIGKKGFKGSSGGRSALVEDDEGFLELPNKSDEEEIPF